MTPFQSLLLLALLATSISAAEIPVADPAAPEAALKEIQPGDTLHLRNGTWADALIKIRARGTAEAPVTIKA